MPALGDIEMSPIWTNKPHTKKWCCVVPIGGSGATGTLLQPPDPGMAVAKSATGTYAVTGMPFAQLIATGKSRVTFGLFSPTPTVGSVVITASDFNAGTMTFKTCVGVTATEPASGDYITILFEGEAE